MPASHIGILLVAGLVGGFVNTVAGAGSVLTVPALMLLGLPPAVANATNRIAVLAQSVSGGVGFGRRGHLDAKSAVAIVAPTLLGAAIGAWTSALVDESILRPVLLLTMVGVALVFVLVPGLGAPQTEAPVDPRSKPLSLVALFFAGVYGGFVQAGVGLVLLAILTALFRYDLVRANALKAVITACFTVVSLLVFVVADKVRWVPGIVLSVGSALGAHLAVRVAVRSKARFLRGVVLVVAIGMSIAVLVRAR